VRFAPVQLRESQQIRLQRLYPRSVVKPAVKTLLVPRPTTGRIGGQPLRDTTLLRWADGLLDALFAEAAAAAPAAGAG
jgi:transcription-repair coupling factor (superfamily II helicase)